MRTAARSGRIYKKKGREREKVVYKGQKAANWTGSLNNNRCGSWCGGGGCRWQQNRSLSLFLLRAAIMEIYNISIYKTSIRATVKVQYI